MVDQGRFKHSLFNFQEADIDKDCLRLHHKNANTSYTCLTRAPLADYYIPSFVSDTPLSKITGTHPPHTQTFLQV